MAKRSAKWKNSTEEFNLQVKNKDANPSLVEALENCPDAPAEREITSGWLLGASRELILHEDEDGTFKLQAITFTLDARTGGLILEPGWSAVGLDRDEVKRQLALATAREIPVYPEDEDVSGHLQAIFADLIANGVEFDEDGEKRRYVWKRGNAIVFDASSSVAMSPTESFFPADALVLADSLQRQHAAVSEAVRTLASLKAGTESLRRLLELDIRDEAALQLCLRENPILFGLEYSAVVPKYKLGKTFEMDFALRKHSGLVDLLEIEPSNLPLYTKAGNPSQYLVHAEQQVLDWLEWLESNVRLARDDLPGLVRPVAQVCIGSRSDLSDTDAVRLRRRNSTWAGTITILTYEDLLDRADNVLDALTRTHEAAVNAND